MAGIYLVIDHREKHISRHSSEFADITAVTRQLTIGDFVVQSDNRIYAVFERKTLPDAAASIRDGRWNNREKLFALRDAHNCRVFFIIERNDDNGEDECPQMPRPNAKCDRGMLYKQIESSLFHMAVRDNICILFTANSIDTAKMMVRFVKSMQTLTESADKPKFVTVGRPTETITPPQQPTNDCGTEQSCAVGGAESSCSALGNASGCITAETAMKRQTHDIMRDIWSQIDKISRNSAEEYFRAFSLRDLFSGSSVSRIKDFKLSSGKRPQRAVLQTFENRAAAFVKAMIKKIPGFGATTVDGLFAVMTIEQIMDASIEQLADIKINNRRLGIAKATDLLYYLEWKAE